MPKLVYLATIRLPTEKAHGLQIMKTCEALADQGVEVELVVPNRLNPIKTNAFDFYKVRPNFKLNQLPVLDLISSNILGSFGFGITSRLFYRAARKKYFAEQPIFYTRDLPTAYWLAKDGKKYYYEIHTLPQKITDTYRSAWNSAAGLIVISDALREDLAKCGVSAEKIIVARDAVDYEQFKLKETKAACREKLSLPEDQKIVVYTGHLYDWKGADLLAQAASKLLKNIHIYLVGGTATDIGRFRSTYVSGNLHVVGWQDHATIPYWLKAADLLILPNTAKSTISARYTSPLKLFEYLASGTPVLCSDLPSLREVIGESGSFFKPDDLESLCYHITSLLNSPLALSHEPGLELYSWSGRAKKIISFITNK